MRSATLAIAILVCHAPVLGQETSTFERICGEIGFKKKTEAFGECVLELHAREAKVQKNLPTPTPLSQSRVLSEDEVLCEKYGFVYGSTEFAQCRQRFELARQELRQKQLEFEQQQRQYEFQKQQYEAQLAEQKRQQEIQRSLRLMQFGLGLASGQSPNAAENLANASRAAIGLPPVAPTPPAISTFTISSPQGIRSCNVAGRSIYCN